MYRPSRAVLGGALFALPLAFAAGASAADATGWYVEVKHGESTLDHAFGSTVADGRFFDDDSSASSAEVGYSLNRYFGLQAGYHDLGTFRGLRHGSACPPDAEACILVLVGYPIDLEMTGWSLAAVGSWPWTDRFSLYGKLGALEWDSDLSHVEEPPIDGRTLASLSETELLTAVGARYRFPSGFGLLLEHQKLDLDLAASTLGVSWKF